MQNKIRIGFYAENGTVPLFVIIAESDDFNQVELAEVAAEHVMHGFKNSNGSRVHMQFGSISEAFASAVRPTNQL